MQVLETYTSVRPPHALAIPEPLRKRWSELTTEYGLGSVEYHALLETPEYAVLSVSLGRKLKERRLCWPRYLLFYERIAMLIGVHYRSGIQWLLSFTPPSECPPTSYVHLGLPVEVFVPECQRRECHPLERLAAVPLASVHMEIPVMVAHRETIYAAVTWARASGAPMYKLVAISSLGEQLHEWEPREGLPRRLTIHPEKGMVTVKVGAKTEHRYPLLETLL
jgi:hypothetical protein